MGSNESNPVRNIDKRTARREYRTQFIQAIDDFRASPRVKREEKESEGSNKVPLLEWKEGETIRVCVRKRPIFDYELENSEFDVVSCIARRKAVIHDARMQADMKHRFMNHHSFVFDRVFDENVSNGEVYSVAAKPLVRVAVEGGFSTCCVYGQTGSGKTFTMSSFYSAAARDIFQLLDEKTARFSVPPRVSCSFIELHGDSAFDLLNSFTPTQLLTGADGCVHAFPCVEPTVSCADELISMITHAISVRSTAQTGVNDTSSRSHALLRVYIQTSSSNNSSSSSSNNHNGVGGAEDGDEDEEGVLTLVDLAGSEHRIDSMYHSAERRKEGAGINASLMALKVS